MLTADFTTTTKSSLIASKATIMHSMKEYCKYYSTGHRCGLSSVTIEGTVEDWQSILSRLEYLAKFDLEWWISELRPILQQIINTKNGNISINFWKDMISSKPPNKYYGFPDNVDGWITKFFPYKTDQKRSYFGPIIDINNVPSEIIKVPFTLEMGDAGVKYESQLLTGIFGMIQDPKTFNLKPEIGWAVEVLNQI